MLKMPVKKKNNALKTLRVQKEHLSSSVDKKRAKIVKLACAKEEITKELKATSQQLDVNLFVDVH
jgi:SET domain-containing protein